MAGTGTRKLKRWHPEEIRAAVRMRGGTLTQLAINDGLEPGACRVVPTRPLPDFATIWAGVPAARRGFLREMTRQWLHDAAVFVEPGHAVMLPDALALPDRIAGWRSDTPAATDDPGITPTPPSPIEGEGVLPRAMAAGGGGMSGPIVHILEFVDPGDDFVMAAVFDGGTGAALDTRIADNRDAATLEAPKGAITAHGMPDTVTMDIGLRPAPVGACCRRPGIRMSRPLGSPRTGAVARGEIGRAIGAVKARP